MKSLQNFLHSKNFWTVSVVMFSLWFAFSAYATMFVNSVNQTMKIFLYILTVVLITFLVASSIVKAIYKNIDFKFPFNSPEIDASWIFILGLGSLFFGIIFGYFLFFTFEIFVGFFLLSFFSAGLFRLLINFIISFPTDSKDLMISVTKE